MKGESPEQGLPGEHPAIEKIPGARAIVRRQGKVAVPNEVDEVGPIIPATILIMPRDLRSIEGRIRMGVSFFRPAYLRQQQKCPIKVAGQRLRIAGEEAFAGQNLGRPPPNMNVTRSEFEMTADVHG